MKKFFTITFFTLTILSFVFTLAPITTVFSADYVPLSPLPDLGADKPIAGNFSSYLKGIYKLAIGIAGVLAVMVILFEGIKHMASESFVAKADTSARIGAAVGGLLLALGAYVILYAINPKLVEFNLVLSTVPDAGRLTAPQTTSALQKQQEQNIRRAREATATANATIEGMKSALQIKIDEILDFCAEFPITEEECISEEYRKANIQGSVEQIDQEIAKRDAASYNFASQQLFEQFWINNDPVINGQWSNKELAQIIETRKLIQLTIDQRKTLQNPEVQTAITNTMNSINGAIKTQCDRRIRRETDPGTGKYSCITLDCSLLNTLCESGTLTR